MYIHSFNNYGDFHMLDKALGWIRSLTELGLAVIALGVVLQIIFGAAIPFLGLDIVGSVVALVAIWLRRFSRISCGMGSMGNLRKEVTPYSR